MDLFPTADQLDKADEVICKICRRQFSRYTCPKCNLPYCSLTCFRSESHSRCSETFYRTELESDLSTEPSKSLRERQKMMDLLQRFEEQVAHEDLQTQYSENDDDDDDDDTSLARRMQDIDLERTSPDEVWQLLTSGERDRFLKAINNPSSELAQQLLANEALESDRQEPWWSAGRAADNAFNTPSNIGRKPTMMLIPTKVVQSRANPSLIYNIVAILVAYAYVTRWLSVSPLSSLSIEDAEHKEARRVISNLVPFLVERKSNTLHPSLSSATTAVWSRFESSKMTPKFFALLLRDVAHLLRPSNILMLPPQSSSRRLTQHPERLADDFLESHPSSMAVLGLSDISMLFQSRSSQRSSTTQNHVTLKLIFYAACILSTPPPTLRTVSDELLIRAKKEEEGSLEPSRAPNRA